MSTVQVRPEPPFLLSSTLETGGLHILCIGLRRDASGLPCNVLPVLLISKVLFDILRVLKFCAAQYVPTAELLFLLGL